MTNGFTWPFVALELDCDQNTTAAGWSDRQVYRRDCGRTLFPLHIEAEHGTHRVSI